MALVLAGVLPAQAVRFSKGVGYRTAVFQTATTTRIAVGTNHSASLLNLSVGDRVSIAYDSENGALVAHRISDGVPPNHSNLGVSFRSSSRPRLTPSTLAHIHGIVQSVNVQAGTLAIAYRVR